MTKANFAPVPLRVVRDDDLTGLDHRVLEIIAVRARMNVPADHGTMAEEIGCDYTCFSTSVKKLLGRGYIQRVRAGKGWLYSIIYNDDDRDVLQFTKRRTVRVKTVCQPAKCPDENSLPKQAEQFAEPPRNPLSHNEGHSPIRGDNSIDSQSVSPKANTRAPNGASPDAIKELEREIAETETCLSELGPYHPEYDWTQGYLQKLRNDLERMQ